MAGKVQHAFTSLSSDTMHYHKIQRKISAYPDYPLGGQGKKDIVLDPQVFDPTGSYPDTSQESLNPPCTSAASISGHGFYFRALAFGRNIWRSLNSSGDIPFSRPILLSGRGLHLV